LDSKLRTADRLRFEGAAKSILLQLQPFEKVSTEDRKWKRLAEKVLELKGG